MAVLSIDPGTKLGGALTFDCEPAPRVFTITKPGAWAIYRTIRWAKFEAAQRGEALELATEGQHIGRGPKANPASTLHLARGAERWIVIAELQSVPTIQIMASTWREPMIKGVPTRGPKGEKLDKKKRAKMLVERLWPELQLCVGEPGVDGSSWSSEATSDLYSDPCDAIVMGRWRMLAGRSRPREKAPKKRAKVKAKR